MSLINTILHFLNVAIDFSNRQTLKDKQISLVVVVLLVSGVYGYFYWYPKYQEVQTKTRDLEKKRERLNELNELELKLTSFHAESEKLNEKFNLLLLKLPKDDEIPKLIGNVYSAISSSGLAPVKFIPLKRVNKSFYAEIPIRISLKGSYFELAVFFKKLAQLSRVVNVRDFHIRKDKVSGSGDAGLDITFVVVTYKLVE